MAEPERGGGGGWWAAPYFQNFLLYMYFFEKIIDIDNFAHVPQQNSGVRQNAIPAQVMASSPVSANVFL